MRLGAHPEDRPAFKRQRAERGDRVLDEARHFVGAMRQQPMVAHPDAPTDRGEVEHGRHGDGLPLEEERSGDGPGMQDHQGNDGGPVEFGSLRGFHVGGWLLDNQSRLVHDSVSSLGHDHEIGWGLFQRKPEAPPRV